MGSLPLHEGEPWVVHQRLEGCSVYGAASGDLLDGFDWEAIGLDQEGGVRRIVGGCPLHATASNQDFIDGHLVPRHLVPIRLPFCLPNALDIEIESGIVGKIKSAQLLQFERGNVLDSLAEQKKVLVQSHYGLRSRLR